MQYKTIALEIVKQYQADSYDNSSLHSRMEELAVELRNTHLQILEELQLSQTQSDPTSLRMEALDLAVAEMIDTLRL